MTFVDLQRGDAVFVDANALIYHFTNTDGDFDRVPGLVRYAPV